MVMTNPYGLDIRLWNEGIIMAKLMRILLFIYLSLEKNVIFCQVFLSPWNNSALPSASEHMPTFSDGRTRFGIRPFEGDEFFQGLDQNRRTEPNFRSLDPFPLERRPNERRDDDFRTGNMRDSKPERPRWTRPNPGWNNLGQSNTFQRRPLWTPSPFLTTKPPAPWWIGKPDAWLLSPGTATQPQVDVKKFRSEGIPSSQFIPGSSIPGSEIGQNFRESSTELPDISSGNTGTLLNQNIPLQDHLGFKNSELGVSDEKSAAEMTTLSIFDYPEVSGFITNITADSTFLNVSRKPGHDMISDDLITGRMIASGTKGTLQLKNKVLWLKVNPTTGENLDMPSDSPESLQDVLGDGILDPDKDNGNKKNRVLWVKVTTSSPGISSWVPPEVTSQISIDDVITEATRSYPSTTKYRRRKTKIMTKPTSPTVEEDITSQPITIEAEDITSQPITIEAEDITIQPLITEFTTIPPTTHSITIPITTKSTTISTTLESTTIPTTTESATIPTTTESTTIPTTKSTTIPTTTKPTTIPTTTKPTTIPTTTKSSTIPTTISTTTEPTTVPTTTETTTISTTEKNIPTTNKVVTQQKTTTITTFPTTVNNQNTTNMLLRPIADISSTRNTSLVTIKSDNETNSENKTDSSMTSNIKTMRNYKNNLTDLDINNNNFTADILININNLNNKSTETNTNIVELRKNVEDKDLNSSKPLQENFTGSVESDKNLTISNTHLNGTNGTDIDQTLLTNSHNGNISFSQNGYNNNQNISSVSYNGNLTNPGSERRLEIITNGTNISDISDIGSELDVNRSGRIISHGKTKNNLEATFLQNNSEKELSTEKKKNTPHYLPPIITSKAPKLNQLPFEIPNGASILGVASQSVTQMTSSTHFKAITKRISPTTSKPSSTQSTSLQSMSTSQATFTSNIVEDQDYSLYSITPNPNSISWKSSFRITDGTDWQQNLANKHSLEYKALERSLVHLLDNFFRNTIAPDYGSIQIQGFKKGSIVVDFILYLNPDYITQYEHQSRLKEDFQDHLIEHKGKLGNYTIDDSQVEFEVLGNPRQSVNNNLNVEYDGKTSTLLPQWAVATIVIGCSTIIFIIIFVSVMSYHKTRNKRRFGKRLQDMESVSKSWEKIAAYEDIQPTTQPDVLYSMDDVFEQGATNPGRKKRLAALQNREMSLDPRMREIRERERLREMKERELQRAHMMKDPRMQLPHHAAYYNKGLPKDRKGSWDAYM